MRSRQIKLKAKVKRTYILQDVIPGKQIFSEKSIVITCAKNAKKDSSLSNLTDLIVVPSSTLLTRYRLSISLSLSPSLPLSLHDILRILLRAKTSSRLARQEISSSYRTADSKVVPTSQRDDNPSQSVCTLEARHVPLYHPRSPFHRLTYFLFFSFAVGGIKIQLVLIIISGVLEEMFFKALPSYR